MNDRYLVRGKRKDNGEWVVGYYTVDAAGQEIIDVMNDMGLFESCHTIDPSTLGAYTGIADKNGKMIFDGDIVRTKKYGKERGGCNWSDYDVFQVAYADGGYHLFNKWRRFNLRPDTGAEVIGNIYDNPDLLEEAE